MVRQILFVQGAGEGVHDHWDDKLVTSLERELGEHYAVRYPRMPGEEDPRYMAWRAALVREFDSLEDGAILVGHSVGGTVLLHALAEQPLKFRPGGLFVLAAPYIGEGGWPSDDIVERTDFAGCLPPGVPIRLYHGDYDDVVPTSHVQRYAEAMPLAVVRILERRDHQLNDDMRDVARDIRSMVE